MGGLIKFIKNFFSGIFSFLGGLVGGKKSIEGSAPKTRKSAGYFLELDEAESPKAAVNKTTAETSSTIAFSEATQTLKKESSERSETLATSGNGSVSSAPVAEKAAAPVAVAVAKPEASVEFATKYLVPTSNGSRRRPGANMNSYLDMARAMKPN